MAVELAVESQQIRVFRDRTTEPGLLLAVAAAVIGVIVFGAVLAPWLRPYDPSAIDLTNVLSGPSVRHLLGTDSSGRDILSRLMTGALPTILGPLIVVAISSVIGIPLGIVAAYSGGRTDGAISRLNDFVLAFPALLFAINVIATFGPSLITASIAIAAAYVPLVFRVGRSLSLVERQKPYVTACELLGYGRLRICALHLLPNIAQALGAQLVVNYGYALLDIAALSFLGLGIRPPGADWGVLVSEGESVLIQSPSEALSASAAIAVMVVAFNLLGSGLSERVREH